MQGTRKGFLCGLCFALPNDLRIIATVWWLSFLPDLDGVVSAFKVILASLHAVRTSDLAPRIVIFLERPLLGLFSKQGSGLID